MNKAKEEINIARIIYDAYPHADLLLIDPDKDCRDLQTLLSKVTSENIGDGLFKFIVVEIIEGGRSSITGAIRVMERAGEDVEVVLQALRAAGVGQTNKLTTQIPGSGAELLEACKVITSYTTDLLYQLDNQVNLDDIEEVQQARKAIANYEPAEAPRTKLRNACQQMLETLDIGGEQSRQFAEEIVMLKDALKNSPAIKDDCPKCGDSSGERELIATDFLGIEAIHMHYRCGKCNSEIIEEFTLTDVFIDKPTV